MFALTRRCLLDPDLSARYTRDEHGHFTRRLLPSPEDASRWIIPDFNSGVPAG